MKKENIKPDKRYFERWSGLVAVGMVPVISNWPSQELKNVDYTKKRERSEVIG